MPVCKIQSMDDGLPRRSMEPWDRLEWARLRWQALHEMPPTKRRAADALGMQENTYSAYERAPGTSKHTPLSYEAARQFADLFGVRWEWLLDGSGEPLVGHVDSSLIRCAAGCRAQQSYHL